MVDSALIPVFLNAGVAGVVLLLFVFGLIVPKGHVKDLKEENQRLREALSLERARGDAAVQATNTTNQILGALHEIAFDRIRPDRGAIELQTSIRGVHED